MSIEHDQSTRKAMRAGISGENVLRPLDEFSVTSKQPMPEPSLMLGDGSFARLNWGSNDEPPHMVRIDPFSFDPIIQHHPNKQ